MCFVQLLQVSMGYGVVRPTLGGLTHRVLGLCAGYFIAAASLDIATHVGNVDDLTQGTRVFLVLPVALMDAGYVLWIFSSLSRTLGQLRARRQLAKLNLYAKFTNVLAISVVGSVMWIGYETWFRATDALNEKWESDWVVGAFWHLLSQKFTGLHGNDYSFFSKIKDELFHHVEFLGHLVTLLPQGEVLSGKDPSRLPKQRSGHFGRLY